MRGGKSVNGGVGLTLKNISSASASECQHIETTESTENGANGHSPHESGTSPDETSPQESALSTSFAGFSPQCEEPVTETDATRRRTSASDADNRATGRPAIELTMHRLTGSRPSCTLSMFQQAARPLSSTDLQSFLLYACFGPSGSFKPIWCKFQRWRRIMQVVVVVLDGASAETYEKHRTTCFRFIDSMKNKLLATPSPSFVQDLFSIPLTAAECVKKSNSAFPHEKEQGPVDAAVLCVATEASRVQLLMRMVDMVECCYDLPIPGTDTDHYVYSKDAYQHVTDASPVYALDCEMCVTDDGHELTRISVVDEQYNIVIDELVKPENTIRDYVTQFSGITAAMLKDVTLRLEDVQQRLKQLLPPDAILVGHSINFDFRALKMFHPFVMDIAVLYNLSGMPRMRSSLSTLAEIFLNECVQNSKSGHCSIEDALVTMRLAKLKLKNGHVFGNARYGWDCTEFLKKNPRPRVTGNPLIKQRRKEPVSRPCSPRPSLPCGSCGSEVKIFCANSKCLCSDLKVADSCVECNVLPDIIPAKKIDSSKIFNITLGGKFENVFDFFARNKKSLLWVSSPLHSSTLDTLCKGAKPKNHVHESTTKKKTEYVRARGLEHNFVLMELGLENSSNCGECADVDSCLRDIYDGLVSNTLFCVLLQDCNAQDSTAKFMFRLKQ